MSNGSDELIAYSIPLEMTEEEECFVNQLRLWIQTEAEFYGRTDDEFLIIFVRGCKMNLEKMKQKMNMYYENRRKLPQWWANRDLEDESLKTLLEHKYYVQLIERDDYPLMAITRSSRIPKESQSIDSFIKYYSIMFDIGLRRRSCQMNGFIWIIDLKDCPYWLLLKFFSPIIVKNSIQSFLLALPVKIKQIIGLNTPIVAYAIWKVAKQLTSQKVRDRMHVYSRDWSTVFDHVPREIVPDDYGGTAGSLSRHDDEFTKEVLSYADYIADDSQYGFL